MNKKNWIKKGIACCGAILLLFSAAGCADTSVVEESSTEQVEELPKELTVWYTDAGIEAYLLQAAEAYEELTGIVVTPVQRSSVDYIEAINDANISKDTQSADVYIMSSEFLEESYLAGLTVETEKITDYAYPQTAVESTIYQGKNLGYPFYYETVFFLYNKNFIETPPKTFQEILDFSEQYGTDGTSFDGIQTILKWDVKNLYYNYGFAGAYLNLGGPYGDDESILDLTNESAIESLVFYKQLNQSLYFDADENEADVVLQEFLDGTLLYTIASTQSLSKLEEAYAQGNAYGITRLPDLTDTLETKGLATNYLAQINPYGVSEKASEDLAVFLTDTYIENLYELTGKMGCKKMNNYTNPEIAKIKEAYAHSVQFPKLRKASDYWMELEIAFHTIWNQNLSYYSQDGTDEENAENEERLKEQIKAIVAAEMETVQEHMKMRLNKE